ncbi:TlpA family protein disulfide reductase [Marinobacter vulgaris]|uniref:TlpA family protein disulfide reductase n=1 Tax=Marinobacter vulgaris TaxID=1928331 RepID=UPI001D0DAB82|nr:TlpA disulfide reductase family protein [Marinobacter vulgaris]
MQYPAKSRYSRGLGGPGIILALLMLAGCQNPEFEKPDGTVLQWESLRGHWVLVNYWAEWCKPCLEEIPELNNLDRSPDIVVLGVNFDDIQGQELIELGEAMGIEYGMLAQDPGPEFDWQTPVALPATFIVNPEGDLVEARFGAQTEEDIKKLIGR